MRGVRRRRRDRCRRGSCGRVRSSPSRSSSAGLRVHPTGRRTNRPGRDRGRRPRRRPHRHRRRSSRDRRSGRLRPRRAPYGRSLDHGGHRLGVVAVVLHGAQRLGHGRVGTLIRRHALHLAKDVDPLGEGWMGREPIVELASSVVGLVVVGRLDPQMGGGVGGALHDGDVGVEFLERCGGRPGSG